VSEILHIKNFGPIKDVKLELQKFNILIGESGTGKSTVAKVLAMCRYFSYLVGKELEVLHRFEDGLDAWGLQEYYKWGTHIFYDCEHYTFEIKRSLKVNDPLGHTERRLTAKTQAFNALLSEYRKLEASEDKDSSFFNVNWQPPTSFFINDVNRVLINPFFIHTERNLQSYFSLSKETIANVSSALDIQFRKLYDITKSYFKTDVQIEPLRILYKNENGNGVFRKENSTDYFALSNSASGYKSLVPIVLILKYYRDYKKKQKSYIIEEPEQNIFPTTQYELIKFFTENLESISSLLLTTHSPYILTSLNNLMYAFNAGQNSPKEANEIIDAKYWINPKDVSAYILLKDGTYENIIDKDVEGATLIKVEKIDEISEQLNIEFNKLIDLEIVNSTK
jgi:AAA ATPase domain